MNNKDYTRRSDGMDENDVVRLVDELADDVEDKVELCAKEAGISVEEMINRLRQELMSRFG